MNGKNLGKFNSNSRNEYDELKRNEQKFNNELKIENTFGGGKCIGFNQLSVYEIREDCKNSKGENNKNSRAIEQRPIDLIAEKSIQSMKIENTVIEGNESVEFKKKDSCKEDVLQPELKLESNTGDVGNLQEPSSLDAQGKESTESAKTETSLFWKFLAFNLDVFYEIDVPKVKGPIDHDQIFYNNLIDDLDKTHEATRDSRLKQIHNQWYESGLWADLIGMVNFVIYLCMDSPNADRSFNPRKKDRYTGN